jgi:hypothetical protein
MIDKVLPSRKLAAIVIDTESLIEQLSSGLRSLPGETLRPNTLT